ncbi:MAG: dTDP-4-dehydrorhamnose reductase [Lactobacillus sp.]|uniref:dTDP-4-dehydrorhamnose reductase n=1 Tax=Bombilactobacillus bombi TaxID=1303590 RepID=UPI0035E4E5A9|nr:dTDP-4-dehydrorhamnose reductase [Lactobacillus sp.]
MANNKILILGANGQLGTELQLLLQTQKITYLAPSSQELDITDLTVVKHYLARYQPQVIFDCAAYTKVDAAETEPGKSLNYKVNDQGTANLAQAAQEIGATLFYISTDYVFDGTKLTAYQVDDQPHPQNEYGKAKLAGEQHVTQMMNNYYIIRTSWVFGQYGANFVKTMLHLAQTHDQITVVNDQFGRPTWTKTLAEFMVFAWQQRLDFGIYQLANMSSCSWYEFAQEILKNQAVKVLPVTSNQYPQVAQRPKHSILSIDKVLQTRFEIPSWQTAVNQCFDL